MWGSLGGGGAAGRAEPRLYSLCCMRIQAGAAGTREAQWQEEVCVCVCVLLLYPMILFPLFFNVDIYIALLIRFIGCIVR